MIITSITDFRTNIKSYLDKMKDTFQSLTITNKGENYVLMTESEYKSMKEYEHLMSSKANRENLFQAKKEIDQGDVVKFGSIDDLKDEFGIE